MTILSVTRVAQTLVTPSEPTPAATLPLSYLDCHPNLIAIRMLQVYPDAGEDPAPARAMSDALAKALVHYYPLAGRLASDAKSKHLIQVDCNGRGAWLTEARALCTLKDVRHLDHPYLLPLEELVPVHQEEDGDDPLLHLQVTQFTCGGVAVGVKIKHAMVDGVGLGQFLNAVAELARGYEQPTMNPVWLRDKYPCIFPSDSSSTSNVGKPDDHLLHHCVVDIPVSYVDRVKKDYMEKMGVTCTTFEVSAASIWQCRTRAIEFEPHTDVTLNFIANTRGLLSDVLPPEGGYYGNSFHPNWVTASSQFISNASILEVVKLVGDAKAKFASMFVKWRSGDFSDLPSKLELGYGTLVVSDWGMLGFEDVDYGWGTPSRVICAGDWPCDPLCVFDLPPTGENSRRATMKCVKEEHLAAFQHEMMKLA